MDKQTCYHHPPCRLDQVCQLATSTANDCVFEGDEHRKHLQQTVWDLKGHSPPEHESTVLVPVESDGKIERNSLCQEVTEGAVYKMTEVSHLNKVIRLISPAFTLTSTAL